MSVVHFTDSNFKQEVLESKLPVVVDFWATRCGPCKMIAPAVEECAKEFAGKAKVGKVNVEDSPKTASHYGIMSIPTIVFFKNGKVMDQLTGTVSKAELKRRIEDNL